MTKEQFDNYKFSVNTEINYFEDIWDKITEVDFGRRYVGIEKGPIINLSEIKGIRN